MESLLLDYAIGKTTYAELVRVNTELQYSKVSNLSAATSKLSKQTQHHPSGINSLALDNVSSKLLLSGGSDSSMKLWDVSKHRSLKCLHYIPRKTGHQYGISCMKWWPDDTGMFLSASFDHTVKVWDTSVFEEAYSFKLDSKVYDIDLSICSQEQHSLIATATESSLIRLIDLRSTSTSQTLRGHQGKVLAVKWSPTNPFVMASGGVDGQLNMWDIRRANNCVCTLDQSISSSLDSDSFSGDCQRKRKYEAVGDGPEISNAHNGAINSVIFNYRGDQIISTGTDSKIRVWDLKPAHGANMLVNFGPVVKNRYPQHLSPCLSPRQETEIEYLWFPNDNGEILIFNSQTGQLHKRLNQNTGGPSARVTSIMYAGSHSSTYYSASLDGKISVWGPDLKAPAPIYKTKRELKDEIDRDDEAYEYDPHKEGANVLDEIHHELNHTRNKT